MIKDPKMTPIEINNISVSGIVKIESWDDTHPVGTILYPEVVVEDVWVAPSREPTAYGPTFFVTREWNMDVPAKKLRFVPPILSGGSWQWQTPRRFRFFVKTDGRFPAVGGDNWLIVDRGETGPNECVADLSYQDCWNNSNQPWGAIYVGYCCQDVYISACNIGGQVYVVSSDKDRVKKPCPRPGTVRFTEGYSEDGLNTFSEQKEGTRGYWYNRKFDMQRIKEDAAQWNDKYGGACASWMNVNEIQFDCYPACGVAYDFYEGDNPYSDEAHFMAYIGNLNVIRHCQQHIAFFYHYYDEAIYCVKLTGVESLLSSDWSSPYLVVSGVPPQHVAAVSMDDGSIVVVYVDEDSNLQRKISVNAETWEDVINE